MGIRLPFVLQAGTRDEITDELKQLWRIAGPMVLANLLMYMRNMVTVVFLGSIGKFALAGGGLSTWFTNIFGYSVLSGLASGMDPICSQAFGSENWNLIGRTFHRTVLMLVLACIPISILWMNIENIMVLARQDSQIAATAKIYVLSALPDLAINSFLYPLRAYLRNQGITSPIMWCTVLAVLGHIPLNFVLVSVLKLGIRGVAIATEWTNFNVVAFLLTYVSFTGVYKRTCEPWSFNYLKECVRCPSSEWCQLLRLAIPSCVAMCLEWWWFEIISFLAGYLSNPETNLATMSILISTTSLLYAIPSALSLSVSTRVGNELGANRPDKAKLATFVALGCGMVAAFISLALTIIFRNKWGRLFSHSPDVLALVASVMPIIGISEVGNCPQTTGCGVLRATARPSLAVRINLLSFYLVGMPVAIVMAWFCKLGFQGLWYGLLAAQTVCAIAVLLAVFRTDWSMEARRARQLTGQGLAGCADRMGAAFAIESEIHELLSCGTQMPLDEESEILLE